MISKYNHKEINWVDLESPKEEEILLIMEQYSIPTDIKDRIILNKIDNNIDINHDSIFVSIHNKIIFLVSDDIVLTIHKEPIEAFNQFSKEMELDMVGEGRISNHKLLFAYLLKNLYISSQNQSIIDKEQILKLQKQTKIIIKKNNKLKIVIVLLIILLIIFIWL